MSVSHIVRSARSRAHRVRILTAVAAPTAVVLVLAGCDKPSTAATVGDQRVSVSQLQHLVRDGLSTPAVARVWSGKESQLTRAVLGRRITELQVRAAAKRAGVSATTTDVSAIESAFAAQGVSDSSYTSVGIVPSQQRAFLRTIALGARVAVAAGAAQVPDVVRFGLLRVPDRLAAGSASAKLKADPSSYAAVAASYEGSEPKPVEGTSTAFVQQFGASLLTAAKSGGVQTEVAAAGKGQKDFAVLVVLGVEKGTLDRLEQLSDPSEAQRLIPQAYQSGLQKGLFTSGAVRVNPRYGSWNAKTGTLGDLPTPGLTLPKQPAATPVIGG